MDFPHPDGSGRFLPVDHPTITLMVAVTLVIQALVISFHSQSAKRYPGIRMFQLAALVLAVSSLLLAAMPWVSPELLVPTSSILALWGAVLQYIAMTRFLDRRASRALVWTFGGVGTGVLVALALSPGPNPIVIVREVLTIPLYFGAAAALWSGPIQGFRTGAILTALPFLGYGLASVVRLARMALDPVQWFPGPSLHNEVDALVTFVLNFLWTAGFLLMINQRLQQELTLLATTDPLTQCVNRRAMGGHLAEAQGRFERYDRPYSVVLIDLDRFKSINDTLGHGTGDRVLTTCSQLLTDLLRSGDVLSRWGGEEFLLLLPETEESQAVVLADRLRLRLEEYDFRIPNRGVTFSAGVAGARPQQTPEELIRRADQGLYQAKVHRNRVVLAP